MRSVKEIGKVRPRNLYGRKFKVAHFEFLDESEFEIEYKIIRIPEDIDNARYIGINDEEHCWVEWELNTGGINGVDYMWRTVIGNIEDGTWILI